MVGQKTLVIACAGANKPALDKIPQLISQYHQIIFVGIDRGSLVLMEAGYPLRLAIGDFDSMTSEDKEAVEVYSQEFLPYPSAKDDTDTELAFAWIFDHYPQADLVVLGALGLRTSRLDHLISNLYLVYQDRFRPYFDRVTFIEDHIRLAWYFPGHHRLKAGNHLPDYLSIISLTPVKDLVIQGAKYQLRKTDLAYPRALISNEFVSINHEIDLSFSQGLIMVMWIDEKEEEE